MSSDVQKIEAGKPLQVNEDLVLMRRQDAEDSVLLFVRCREFLKLWRDGVPPNGPHMLEAVDAMEDVVNGHR